VSSDSELIELVRRIIERDARAEDEMARRYKNGIFQIIFQVVRNHAVAEDLCQDTLVKALEKIRQGDVREPARLSGFILGIAKFIAIDYIRKLRSAIKIEDVGAAEHVPDPANNPYEQIVEKENAQIVRRIIGEMSIQRDRDVLFRYYILEEEKDKICTDLRVSREQLSRIIFRARQRYKELHEKLAGKIR
jgi:RNA polymerase sigma-70 factor, ECF subfamily